MADGPAEPARQPGQHSQPTSQPSQHQRQPPWEQDREDWEGQPLSNRADPCHSAEKVQLAVVMFFVCKPNPAISAPSKLNWTLECRAFESVNKNCDMYQL